MIRHLIAAVFAVTIALCTGNALLMAVPAHGAQQPRTVYVACATEDSTDCVWDARHRGNGMGQSLWIGEGGRKYPLPHHIAHYLLGLPTPPR